MPSTLRAAVDIRDLAGDLRAIRDGLDQPIRDTLGGHAAQIADIARGFMHHGQPSWRGSSAERLYPEGVSGYYDSKVASLSASIGTMHPGAPVWEWGGDIHPRDSARHAVIRSLRVGNPRRRTLEAGVQIIAIPRDQAANRAAESDMPSLTQDLDDAVDRLIAEYGF
jgi:hypothetical protein